MMKQHTCDCTAEGLSRFSATQTSTATENRHRQQETKRAEQEATGWKPLPSRCHGNTNQTQGGKPSQGEHGEWDEGEDRRIGELVEVALAG